MADEPEEEDLSAPTKAWALFDAQGAYKGGVYFPEPPSISNGANPHGYIVREVTRFPQYYEKWDPTTNFWKADETVKAAKEREFMFSRVPPEVQDWLLNEIFPALLPNVRPTQAQRDQLFPGARRRTP